jgi:hypothetical protein
LICDLDLQLPGWISKFTNQKSEINNQQFDYSGNLPGHSSVNSSEGQQGEETWQ